jgi:hypothetical protein
MHSGPQSGALYPVLLEVSARWRSNLCGLSCANNMSTTQTSTEVRNQVPKSGLLRVLCKRVRACQDVLQGVGQEALVDSRPHRGRLKVGGHTVLCNTHKLSVHAMKFAMRRACQLHVYSI